MHAGFNVNFGFLLYEPVWYLFSFFPDCSCEYEIQRFQPLDTKNRFSLPPPSKHRKFTNFSKIRVNKSHQHPASLDYQLCHQKENMSYISFEECTCLSPHSLWMGWLVYSLPACFEGQLPSSVILACLSVIIFGNWCECSLYKPEQLQPCMKETYKWQFCCVFSGTVILQKVLGPRLWNNLGECNKNHKTGRLDIKSKTSD